MLISEKYQIKQNFIPDLPQIPFKDGVGNYSGICLHATATWLTTPENERNYETTHWENAFVHTFTSELEILQVASFDYVSWGCCSEGNKFLINCELTQDHDQESFLQAYDRWVWLAAKLLFQRKLGVIDNVTLWSHDQVTKTFKLGDHEDPISYLASHNVTWQKVVSDVTNYYNQFEEENKMLEQLQGQIQRLQQEVATLKDYNSMSSIPSWSQDAINAALNAKIIDSPENRSYDFYAIMTILHRKGII